MSPEELKAKRRQILINVLGKSETIVELKEIKELLGGQSSTLKELVDKILEAGLKPENSELLDEVKKLNSLLGNVINKEIPVIPDRISIDWENAPRHEPVQIPKVTIPEFPKKIDVDWENAPRPKVVKIDKVRVDWENQPKTEIPEKIKVDWENAPKQKEIKLPSFTSPIIWLRKQLETFLAPFLNRIISLISEPDRTEIRRNYSGEIDTIVDHYGSRRVTYKMTRNDSREIKEVTRNERQVT